MHGTAEERYRIGPVVRLRFGDEWDLLRFPLSGVNRLVPRPLANHLCAWTTFIPLEDGIRDLRDRTPQLSGSTIFEALKDLAACGGLMAESMLWSSQAVADREMQPAGIRWVVMPTANRPDLVARALRSYASNIQQFERQCHIGISDSSAAESRAYYAALAMELESHFSLPLWYCGPEDKSAYVQKLVRYCDAPPDVIQFGLCGESSPVTVGASRNLLLCLTAGSSALMIDDDTICDPALCPGTMSGIDLKFHRNPAETWCFLDRASAFQFGCHADIDIIGAHERYLARNISDVIRPRSPDTRAGGLDQLCEHVIASIQSGLGYVRVTVNGARGDSGFHSDIGLVCHESKTSRQRLQEWGNEYDKVLASRAIARQPLCATLSHADTSTVGMFMGLDNRRMLPPFLPEGRNEDGVFAQVLQRACCHTYSMHLPFTLIHAPPQDRAYAPDRDVVIRHSDLIACLVSLWAPLPALASQQDRLTSIGRHLSDLATLPLAGFAELMNTLTLSLLASKVTVLEARVKEDGPTARLWAEDIHTRIDALRSAAQSIERCPDGGLSGARELQSTAYRYAQLLEYWPAITEAAIRLREDGFIAAERLNR